MSILKTEEDLHVVIKDAFDVGEAVLYVNKARACWNAGGSLSTTSAWLSPRWRDHRYW